MCSCETLQEEYPNLKDVFEFLKKIYLDSDILPEQMRTYTDGLVSNSAALDNYFSNEIPVFMKIYTPSSLLEGAIGVVLLTGIPNI